MLTPNDELAKHMCLENVLFCLTFPRKTHYVCLRRLKSASSIEIELLVSSING